VLAAARSRLLLFSGSIVCSLISFSFAASCLRSSQSSLRLVETASEICSDYAPGGRVGANGRGWVFFMDPTK
jgi:hypothetical protein